MIHVLLIVLILDAVFQGRKLFRSIRFFNNSQEQIKKLPFPVKYPSIFILIPVFQEQKIIVDTIQYFLRLIQKIPSAAENMVRLVIIGSAREKIVTPAEETTLALVKNFLKDRGLEKKVWVYESPYTTGSKSTQLNYFVSLQKEPYGWYIIFDADSRPEAGFIEIFLKSNPQEGYIYQLVSNYLSNMNLQIGWQAFQNAISLNQTNFSFGLEYYNSIPKRLFHRFASNSVIGHGLIIHHNLLRLLGWFPDPIEDSRLANMATLRNIDVLFLPAYDAGTIPEGVWPAIKQYSGWFYGQMFLFLDVFKISSRDLSLRKCLKFIHRTGINIYWLLKTPFVVGTTVAVILAGDPAFFFGLLLILLLGHIKILFLCKLSFAPKIRFKHVFQSVLWDFFYSLGPILYVGKAIVRVFSYKPVFLPGTKKTRNLLTD